MENFFEEINAEISLLVCEKHTILPVMEVNNGKIKIVTCCLEFKITCYLIAVKHLLKYQKENKPIPSIKPEVDLFYKVGKG